MSLAVILLVFVVRKSQSTATLKHRYGDSHNTTYYYI